MDRCGKKRYRFHFPACPTRSPQSPHLGLSAFIRHYRMLKHLQAYFMALPTPVLSDGDIVEVQSRSAESARLIRNTWSQDPTTAAVLQYILHCRSMSTYHYYRNFYAVISMALGQNRVSSLHHSSLGGAHYLNSSRIPPKLRITSVSCFHILTPGLCGKYHVRESDCTPLHSSGYRLKKIAQNCPSK